MPAALLRACSTTGCPNLTDAGKCTTCAAETDRRRGSAHKRGYDHAWVQFRAMFRRLLIRMGIVPVCGASLPTGPDTRRWSQCAAAGLLNDRALHLDHEPPLTADERAAAAMGNRAAIDDANRVGYLCQQCHARKTMLQGGGGHS